VRRQLLQSELGGELLFGPLKRNAVRAIELHETTVALLRAHKAHQAEVKMANRSTAATTD
jgi:hypothetical protein